MQRNMIVAVLDPDGTERAVIASNTAPACSLTTGR
jgi:hypothetical protein